MPTVLVVDDEPDILEILQITLENAGYRVVTAGDGAEALDVVSHTVPDAVLLDVGMPEIDGWGVLDSIKSSAQDRLAEVPVVMITAWTSEEDRLRGGIEGAVRYVGKPFDPFEIVEIIDELLSPASLPEPQLRRRVQHETLERLARLERGGDPDAPDATPRVHLTRLDRPHPGGEEPDDDALSPERLAEFVASLSPSQRQIVESIIAGRSIGRIAQELDVSRSNVYAIVRRIAKRVGTTDGRSLIARLRRIGVTSDL